MILQRLRARNFRSLADFDVDFGPGLNVVRGPNEAGKSTLQAALVALLFSDPGLLGRGEMSVERMRSWGSEKFPVLSADLAGPDHEYCLVKDFEQKRAELTAGDGTTVTDRGEVMERVAELVGVGDEAVYKATACLLQQQWANVSAESELRELLQRTLTGGAEGTGSQEIVEKLDKAIGELERGVRGHAPVNPGPLASVISERSEVEAELSRAQAEVNERERARKELETAEDAIREIDGELENRVALEKRVARYLELERKAGELAEREDEISRRLQRIERLETEIEALEKGLGEGPQVDTQLAADVLNWSERAGERAEELEQDEAEARRLDEERKRLEAETRKAAEQRLSSEIVERGRELRAEAEEARAAAAQHAATVAECSTRIAEGRRYLVPRRYLIASGVALVVGGVVLAFLSSDYLALTALGLIAWSVGVLLGPPAGLKKLPGRLEEARAAHTAKTQDAEGRQRELEELLSAAGCESLDELAEQAAAQERARITAAARLENTRSNIAVLRERIDQTSAIIHSLEEKLQDALDAAGLKTKERLVEEADAREKARRALRDKQQTRDGALGGETREALEERRRELSREWRGRQDELESPELATARMSPEDYQSLLSRIKELQEAREEREREARQAERAIAGARHDADSLSVLEGEREQLVERERLLQDRLNIRTLAREVIVEAEHETLAAVTEAIAPRMGELLAQLTGNRYCEISLDDEMGPRVSLPESGQEIELSADRGDASLSCATREQVFLAARLAMMDMLWPEGGPPLLLDDPLVNFDGERRQAALAAIKSASKTHQVILFTCTHEYDAVAEQVIELAGP